MAEKIEYLWHSNNDEYAQFWTKGSVQKYFSAPNTGMPPEFINSTADIFAPAPLARDPLPAHGIHAGGYAVHVSGYYHSRRRRNYHVLLFVLSGVFSVSFDGQKRELKRGDALCVPAQCVCGDSVKKGEVSLFWLHLKQSSRLDFGAQPTVFRPEIFESVSAALKIYLDEVYSPRRSISTHRKIARRKLGQTCRRKKAENFAAKRRQTFSCNARQNGRKNGARRPNGACAEVCEIG